MNSSICPKSLG